VNEAFFIDGPFDGLVLDVDRLDPDLYVEAPEGIAHYEQTLRHTYVYVESFPHVED
jgi:hypothetical protein